METRKISEQALLINLSISSWTGQSVDRKITKEIEDTHNAHNSGRFTKVLLARVFIKPVQQAVSSLRTFHYTNTLAWDDNGSRLLTTKNYFDYMQKLSQLKAEFHSAVEGLIRSYADAIADARIRLNGMFKESDYPTANEIRDKFDVSASFSPMPQANFVIALASDEADKIRKEVENQVTQSLQVAVQDTWGRVKDVLKNMSQKLHDPEGIFRDTLFTNISDLAELLPRLNITDSEDLNNVCRDLQKVVSVGPEMVRQNSNIRKTQANEADAILNKFKDFFQS